MKLEELVNILVCPACKGTLEFVNNNENAGYCCHVCSKIYPVRQGIPIMLINEAIPVDLWEKEGGEKYES